MRNVSPENNKIFWMAPILVLAIGTFPLPIGYYTLSRLVVCASAINFAYNFYKKNLQYGTLIRENEFNKPNSRL